MKLKHIPFILLLFVIAVCNVDAFAQELGQVVTATATMTPELSLLQMLSTTTLTWPAAFIVITYMLIKAKSPIVFTFSHTVDFSDSTEAILVRLADGMNKDG